MKMSHTARRFLSGALALLAPALQAATWYVAPTGNDTTGTGSSSAPYLTIQRGVTAANPGDTVLVAPGTYGTGHTTPAGKSRVAITEDITVRSTQGAAQTIILGSPHSLTEPFGANSVRCVYMTAGTLDGFTLQNGFANAGSIPSDRDTALINGGGVYAPNQTPQVNNCIITGSGAYRGGGAYRATLNNCTVVSNDTRTASGDGVWGSLVRNSIVLFNGDENYSSTFSSVDQTLFQYSCTTPAPGVTSWGFNHDGGNNITSDPQFVPGTLRPANGSPCVNAGNNAYASGPRDAAGSTRILGSAVDLGAYENTYVLYPLTVVNGSGSGSYTNGAVVPITAYPPAAWAAFTGWAGDTAAVANVSSASTTVTMPAAPATVIATYSTPSLSELIGDVLNIPQPVSDANITLAGISTQPPEVRLGPIGDSQTAFFATVYTNAGTLLFPWRVSCEAGFDRLALFVDGAEVASLTGEASGVVTQFVAGAGAHAIRWAYIKDASDYAEQDSGWVGAVTWIPDNLAAELGVPGRPIAFPYGKPGKSLPFPYGFDALQLDSAAPAGALGGVAAKLGGLTNGAPVIADGQTTGAEVVLNGSGQLTFQWRTSSQNSDTLFCVVDGVEAARISGTKTNVWLTFSTNLLNVAAHSVRWAYAKNASGFSGEDCGWIDSVTWAQHAYALTVENGSGSGTYAVGDTVAITANPPPAGQEFDVWDGDTETINNLTSPSATLVMPGRAITVRALYKTRALTVTVINGNDAGAWPNAVHEGTGEPEGRYPAGALVRIVAAPPPLWQTFDRWVSADGALFSNAYADVSLFVMPPNSVTVTATYRPQTDAEKLAGALTIRGQALVVTSFSSSGVVAEATGGIRYDDPVVKLGGPSVGPNQSVSLTTTNFTGNGYLLFWWHGDTEKDVDGIQLVINGTPYSQVISMKDTNSFDRTRWWTLTYAKLTGVNNVTFRFTRDDTYYVHNNMVLLDRVMWIPDVMVTALDAGHCLPNINQEYDPLFQGRNHSDGEFDFAGEDGGVRWVDNAPGGFGAIQFGNFGYVTNNLQAQVCVTNHGTGILTWKWTSKSEGVYDNLGFYLDGNRTNWISGKLPGTWYDSFFVLPNDPAQTREINRGLKRIFTYRYQKDNDVSMLDDCAWLRGVEWTPTFALQVISGTNTSYVLPPPFNTFGGALREAKAGIFPAGAQVTILADPPQEGFYFDRWTGNDLSALGTLVTNANPTFLMPPADLALTATYTTNAPVVPHYALTVMSGSGSGSYPSGTVVTIQANPAPLWHTFSGWTGDIGSVANPTAATTTILIGTVNLTVSASYTSTPIEDILSLVLGIPAPVTVGNIPVSQISLTPPSVSLGPIGDSQTAFFTTVYVDAGTIMFPWSVDCEEGYDFLSFSVDGAEVARITGQTEGVVTNFISGSGPHTLRWAYTKDGSDAAGADAGTVGAVTWIPDALAAEFGVPGKPLNLPEGSASILLDLAPPAGAIGDVAAKLGGPATVANGSSVSVEAVFSGAGNLAFYWRVSSELNHDFLAVSVDGVEAARLSGTKNGWIRFETNLLTVADHTIRWTYLKDGANTAGLDCGWVDSAVWTQITFDLTVVNGGGSGTYAVGDTVSLTADPAPAGQEFDLWDGDTATIADVKKASTTLVMPARDITVRALYRPKKLVLTMVNGRDGGAWPNAVHESIGEPEGAYPAGAEVRIIANTAPLWQTFDQWVSTNGAVFADSTAAITTFLMPANSVTVEARYRAQTPKEKLAGALTIAGQPLTVTKFSTNGVIAEAAGGVRYNDPVVKFGGASVGPGQTVGLTTTSFQGDGVLLFWWQANAETGYDRIQVVVNGSTLVGECSGKGNGWWAMTNVISGATSITLQFTRDGSYFVRDNTIILDRVIWIPKALVTTMACDPCVPNINGEAAITSFDGEDGGVSWVNDAPDGYSAVRFGRFGYVNNNQHAQLSVTNFGTGILRWQWASSCETLADRLDFFFKDGVDDDVPDRWVFGKDKVWSTTTFVVKNGDEARESAKKKLRHFLFDFRKDVDISVFEDCAWLRTGTWTPTFKLQLQSGTVVTNLLPAQFADNPDVIEEANEHKVFPIGTVIQIAAEPPPSGQAFAGWMGGPNIGAVLGATASDPVCTFVMPGHDFSLTATYVAIPPTPSPPPLESNIRGIAVQTQTPQTEAAALGMQALSAPAAQTVWVELTYEADPLVNHEVYWSPALAGSACAWQLLPVSYRDVLGDSAVGARLFRIRAEIPSGQGQGFFRIQSQ